ncbi:MAG: VanZ family protein, partial [Gammaproteobacteria bacterium]|nr:VanZ family protein [Gammaproteobacteria bacterium]
MLPRNRHSASAGAAARAPGAAILAGCGALYLGAIVYGSLIPFEYRALDGAEAWQRFLQIRYLDLGIGSRADWIANILLYLPFGLLLCALFSRFAAARRTALLAITPTVAIGIASAIAIEYAQVFFAPRTVSLNDLLAETIGTLLGAVLYRSHPARIVGQWLVHLREDPTRRLHRALLLYAIAYVGLNLFPFDFVLSPEELRWKLANPAQGWLFAPAVLAKPARAMARSIVELGVTMPLGMLVAMQFGLTRRRWRGTALAWGLVLGIGCETAQLLLASGVSQGASVLARVLGVLAGARIALARASWEPSGIFSGFSAVRLPRWLATAVALSVVPYLLAVVTVTGWFDAPWHSPLQGWARMEPRMFLPFFFHYFTTEAMALTSLLANAAMYAPLAVGLWLHAHARRMQPPGLVPTLALVVPIALLVEAGKLCVPGRHPDPTNLLIAAAAAAVAWYALRWFEESANAPVRLSAASEAVPAPATTPTRRAAAVARTAHDDRRPSLLCRVLGTALLALTALLTARYPVGAILLALGLGGYALVLYRVPSLWFALVPAALPVLDFADRTGWSLVDEFDLLLLVTLAMLLLRTGWPGWSDRRTRGFAPLLVLFGVFLAISLLRGLLPWEPWSPNAVFSYLSHYHAIRVGKGLLFGLLLWPWARKLLAPGGRGQELLAGGVLAGLALTCAAMVIERWAFVGLFDFSTGYRATAFFTSVNNGGGSIDAYLLLALPFVAACWLVWRNRIMRAAGVVLLAAALYCVLVTYTRIDYLAVAIIGAILFAALARAALPLPAFLAITVPIALISTLLAVMAFGGPFTQQRFSSAATDLQFRLGEWRRDLTLSEPGVGALLFGNGLGSFPRRQYLHAPAGASPAAFAIAADDDNQFLRLGYGTPVFIVQRLARPLPDRVTVTVRMRGAAAGVGLGNGICEKSLLYSFRCEAQVRMRGAASADGWQSWTAELDLRALRHPPQPVYFSLHHAGDSDALVDADAVSV